MLDNFAVKKYFIRRKNAENILYYCRKYFDMVILQNGLK